MEFDTLPLEVRLEIFSYLLVGEVMKIRLVCKQWNDLINCEFKFKKLRCHNINCNLGFIGEPADDFYFESTRCFLDYVSNDAKFSRVRNLDANLLPNYADVKDAFDFLNLFRFVEKLKCKLIVWERSSHRPTPEVEIKQFTVSLNCLKDAVFGFLFPIGASEVSVVLDLLSLHYLCLDTVAGVPNEHRLSHVIIRHPRKLRTLVTDGLFRNRLDYSQFTSLTTIYTGVADVRSITAEFLEKLSSLRELHLCTRDFIHIATEKRYSMNRSFSIKEKLKIFLCGFEISRQQINSPDQQWPESFHLFNSSQNFSQFFVQNRHKSLDNNPQVDWIHYNLMANELSEAEMLGMIFQKFPNICAIYLEGTVADKSRLLKFIDKFRIEKLFLRETALSQSFLENLTQKCSSIRRLHVLHEPTMDILSGDFDFVFKFENLSTLRFSNSLLSLNFVARALKELKKLNELNFCNPSYQFTLSAYHPSIGISLDVFGINDGRSYVQHEVCRTVAANFVRALSRQLNADGFVLNIKELLALLHHIELERKNGLFMMRQYIYDQQHSIWLSEEQMLDFVNNS